MTSTPSSITDSDRLISRTCRQLRIQKTIPQSPGIVDGNKVLLCAGALLVREASDMLRSKEFANEFEREVVTRDSDYIRKVGSAIGLDEIAVNSVVVGNDRLPPGIRLGGTLAHIARLRSVFR